MEQMTNNLRNYNELVKLKTFEERYHYLKLNGIIGKETFGYDRYFNQKFYNSYIWRKVRREVIIRDNACDLGILDRDLPSRGIFVHHMNPIVLKDILDREDIILNPEYLITVSERTHNAIHYGDESLLELDITDRKKGDTKLW